MSTCDTSWVTPAARVVLPRQGRCRGDWRERLLRGLEDDDHIGLLSGAILSRRGIRGNSCPVCFTQAVSERREKEVAHDRARGLNRRTRRLALLGCDRSWLSFYSHDTSISLTVKR
jgi:hypothetical protein